MILVCSTPGCPNFRPCSLHHADDTTSPRYRPSTTQPTPVRSPSSRRTSTHAWQTRIRPYVLRRDKGVCHICKRAGADQVDHLTPVSMGGTDDPSNLAAAHARCNNARGNR